jgi:FkbM family methyltransferase
MTTTKSVLLSDTPFILHGMAADDPYLCGLTENSEEQLTAICKAMLPQKAGIWDIGANIGVTALTMAALNPDWRIIAVEGGPAVYEKLQINIGENGRDEQIKPVHAAVGESDGTVNFYTASAYGHIASRSNESAGFPVRMISASTLHRECGPATIDFVKIDIEGAEFPFLRGGLEIFKRHSSIICMEFNVWCLMYYGRTAPIEFMEWIVQNFADVRLLQHHALNGVQRVTPDNLYNMVAQVMHNMQCICNLLICDQEGRITIS